MRKGTPFCPKCKKTKLEEKSHFKGRKKPTGCGVLPIYKCINCSNIFSDYYIYNHSPCDVSCQNPNCKKEIIVSKNCCGKPVKPHCRRRFYENKKNPGNGIYYHRKKEEIEPKINETKKRKIESVENRSFVENERKKKKIEAISIKNLIN